MMEGMDVGAGWLVGRSIALELDMALWLLSEQEGALEIPIHLQPAMVEDGFKAGDFPVAEQLATRCLSLPIYPELTEADLGEEMLEAGKAAFHAYAAAFRFERGRWIGSRCERRCSRDRLGEPVLAAQPAQAADQAAEAVPRGVGDVLGRAGDFLHRLRLFKHRPGRLIRLHLQRVARSRPCRRYRLAHHPAL